MAKRIYKLGTCAICGKTKDVSGVTANDRACMIVLGWSYMFQREPELTYALCGDCLAAYVDKERQWAMTGIEAGEYPEHAALLSRVPLQRC